MLITWGKRVDKSRFYPQDSTCTCGKAEFSRGFPHVLHRVIHRQTGENGRTDSRVSVLGPSSVRACGGLSHFGVRRGARGIFPEANFQVNASSAHGVLTP